MTYVTKELEESEETAELEDKVQLRRPELSFGPVAERPMQGCRARAASRRRRNRLHRALHGNPAVAVANVGALSNLRLAVRSRPDVALLQELWATAARSARKPRSAATR